MTLDTKAWLVFRDQPWRRFVLFLSFYNEYRELRVHFYDHSGGIVTLPVDIHREPDTFQYIMACIVFGRRDCIGFDLTITMNPKMISPITVNDHEYLLLKVLFSCQGLVGRGTVCYLARRNGEEYIVKDHWVKGNKDAVLNEVKMLEEMEGVSGVPELVEYWLVEVEKGQPDETQNYRQIIHSSTMNMSRTHVRLVLKPQARPLHMFRSRKEFVKIIRDIVLGEIATYFGRSLCQLILCYSSAVCG
ncbi:uncharacterized protein F5891DRAFT_966720 [Suillus fuscotomentosus]|uniref:Fungal-type protein kinase domain-containing protein n=1 Tax=Suillus fuscotomentosus TaxID=1912939 RepID=A0AAD4HCS3_9AGAM|nr:uncharacterized protein F5891DRAFT_966720 [Suillus fuscotomentosus]KAG1887558.1 hypothetical protein F5891DRAFT_966720 [Suillus fuscotomentosus]